MLIRVINKLKGKYINILLLFWVKAFLIGSSHIGHVFKFENIIAKQIIYIYIISKMRIEDKTCGINFEVAN